LNNAVYLGDREDSAALLTASTSDLPLDGRRASERVDFGDSSLLLVMSPTGDLGGGLMTILPWLVGLVGLASTVGATTLTRYLLRRRGYAETLAADNSRLYIEQRSVAQTLQHSLLPDRLPDVAGLQFAARYLPGAAGADIGGDWYDVITVDDDHLLIVVGDVSGRGLRAATAMATLRYASRAFASEGHKPATILSKLNRLLDLQRDGHFATMLCASIDLPAGTLSVANAGHPSPLVSVDDSANYVVTTVGVPIGVNTDATYETTTVPVVSGRHC